MGMYPMDQSSLATNLRLLCSTEASISECCRRIGINRQQFNKYLNGSSNPSATNLRRIASYFGLRPRDMESEPEEFEDLPSVALRLRGMIKQGANDSSFATAFHGNVAALRRYLGYYHCYFYTESWANSIICALVRFDERDGIICSKTIERSRDPVDGTLYLSKYDGQVALLGNRIFVMEFQSLTKDALVETILYPVGRGQQIYLKGTTMGVTSHDRTPFSATVVYRYLGTNIDLRAAMGRVGLYGPNSPKLDSRITAILSSGEAARKR